MQVVAGSSGIEDAKLLADTLDCELIVPEFKIFPDGETFIRITETIKKEIVIVQSCFYPQESNLFQLLNLANLVKELGAEKVQAFVPYMCYARSDRRVRSGEAVSINIVLKLIEEAGIDHLITLDLHNPEVLDRTNIRTTNIYPSISIKKYLEDKIGDLSNKLVVAPDSGAIDRAKRLADELNVGFTSLNKYRNPESGNVSLKLGDAIIDKEEIIIVDDIMSTGGTLVEASNLLMLNGVNKIHYVITHAIGTDAVDKLREIGNGLVVATNSTNTIIGKINVIEDLIQVI